MTLKNAHFHFLTNYFGNFYNFGDFYNYGEHVLEKESLHSFPSVSNTDLPSSHVSPENPLGHIQEYLKD